MRDPIRLPSIPDLSPEMDESARVVLSAIKEIMEVREGGRGPDNLDRVVTFRDLVALGLVPEEKVR